LNQPQAYRGPLRALAGVRRQDALLIAALVVAAVVLGITASMTQRAVVNAVEADLKGRLDVYGAYLDSEVRRFALMPEVLAHSHEIGALLAAPDDAARRAAANAYLARFAATIDASVAYVMDVGGTTLAASNHAEEVSFVGHNYGFRPYFSAAVAGGRGRYVAVGATSNVPGYYVSVPVTRGGAVVGVVVVKWAARDLVPWRRDGAKLLVAGPDGVVFATNDDALRFTRLGRLGEPSTEPLDPRQYADRPLPPLPVHSDTLIDGVRLVTLRRATPGGAEFGMAAQPTEYAVGSRGIAGTEWRLLVLAEVTGRTGRVLVNGITAASGLAVVGLLVGYVQQRRRYVRTLYENAIRDPLTRLYTRLYMNDVVGRMLQNHDRGSLDGVALVIFDIDRFKQVNDTYGHHVGDEVLVGVSAVILDAVRATDVPVRFGGEELAVFLPAGDLDQALRFAERIRARVADTRFPLGDGELRVTLSGGVALHRRDEPLSKLIIRADSALYKAKNGGRNRIAVAAEERARAET